MDKEIKDVFEVIIIGAGAAGIGAALKLKKENVPFVLLQARQRVGGRVNSELIDGIPIDLGACWIHSYGEKNPLRPFVRNLKIEQAVLSKRKGGRIYVDGQRHQQFEQQTLEYGQINSCHLFRLAEKNATKSQTDMSIYDAAKDYIENTISKLGNQQKRCTQLMINLTEHYEGSSIKQLSINNYEYRQDQGGDFLPDCGYGNILNKIVQKFQIKVEFNRVVDRIIYGKEGVFVECAGGHIYKAKKIISSLPLGVLKSKKIKFQPELPAQYVRSIDRLGLGLMNKIIVSFSEPFWDPVSWISIGCNERGKFSHILNLSQKNKHILCCFITDDFARKTQSQSDEHILGQFVKLLELIYEGSELKVKDYKITRWGTDQYSLGSYSSFHVGSSPQDCYQLRKPIADVLWFVGEHCYAEHIGTAHGAFRTGEWASEQVMKSLKWITPMLKQPKPNGSVKKND